MGHANDTARYKKTWVTDYAWISGVTGACLTVAIAYWFSSSEILAKGITIFGWQLTKTNKESTLLALVMIALLTSLVEIVRLFLWDRKSFISIHPKIKSKQHLSFLYECIGNYLSHLFMIWILIHIYHSLNEYGFHKKADYYQAWFLLLEWIWKLYLYIGLPYVIITRLLKCGANFDKHDYGVFFQQFMKKAIRLNGKHSKGGLVPKIDAKASFNQCITLSLLVKFFFTPLMTVFFVNQFPHLVHNIGYMLGDSLGSGVLWSQINDGNYSLEKFNLDLYNISTSLIFSIDVALAWCGYMLSSRWLDNQTISVENTLLGWCACLLCYPPFQNIMSWLYSAPGEKASIYLIKSQWMITVLLVLMIFSYLIYMSATLFFGVRFSNLTNRGIIRKGPFALVRHPAYAAKNFAWWIIMFPAIAYNIIANGQIRDGIEGLLGMILLSFIYYKRAITEERHLSQDPDYVAYSQQVKYRFIPGLF